MPRLSKSNKVKKRVAYLLERLLRYANYELAICDQLWDKLIVRWLKENSSQPQLVVQTELKFLAELIAGHEPNGPNHQLKEQIRHDLRLMRDFLGILEDSWAKTKNQGSANWHFTLKLWHQSTESNLQAFDRTWDHLKASEKAKELQKLDRAEPIRFLKRGAEVWNTWKKKNPDSALDLREANLNGASLLNADLNDADFWRENTRLS